jgi:hypothetical protein
MDELLKVPHSEIKKKLDAEERGKATPQAKHNENAVLVGPVGLEPTTNRLSPKTYIHGKSVCFPLPI